MVATQDRSAPSVCLEADQVVFLYSKLKTQQYTNPEEEVCENVCVSLCVFVRVCSCGIVWDLHNNDIR